VDAIASRLSIERCIIRAGSESARQLRCLVANARDQRVVDCVIGPAQRTDFDAQAVLMYSSPGPSLIRNNELFGTGQCMYFGGAGVMPLEERVAPQDVVFQRNWLRKLERWNLRSPKWDQVNWVIKPGLESKNSLRVLVEGNLIENSFNWPAVHITSRYTLDWTVQHNTMADCITMLNLWDTSNIENGPGLKRFQFYNNLGLGVSRALEPQGLAYARGAMLGLFPLTPARPWTNTPGVTQNGSADWWIEHNTALPTDFGLGVITGGGGQKVDRWRIANNISGYPFVREGRWDATDATLQFSVVTPGDFDVAQNAMLETFTSHKGPAYTPWNWGPPRNPKGQFLIVGTPAAAGVDVTTGRLSDTSPLKGAAVDFDNQPNGRDLGVHFEALAAGMNRLPLPPSSRRMIEEYLSRRAQAGEGRRA